MLPIKRLFHPSKVPDQRKLLTVIPCFIRYTFPSTKPGLAPLAFSPSTLWRLTMKKDYRNSFPYGMQLYMAYSCGVLIILVPLLALTPVGDYLEHEALHQGRYHDIFFVCMTICLVGGLSIICSALHKPKPRRFSDLNFGSFVWGTGGCMLLVYDMVWLNSIIGRSTGRSITLLAIATVIAGLSLSIGFSNRRSMSEYHAGQTSKKGRRRK